LKNSSDHKRTEKCITNNKLESGNFAKHLVILNLNLDYQLYFHFSVPIWLTHLKLKNLFIVFASILLAPKIWFQSLMLFFLFHVGRLNGWVSEWRVQLNDVKYLRWPHTCFLGGSTHRIMTHRITTDQNQLRDEIFSHAFFSSIAKDRNVLTYRIKLKSIYINYQI